MRRFSSDDDLTIIWITWTQPKMMKRDFRLMDRKDELAQLGFSDSSGHSATGSYFGKRFSFLTEDPSMNFFRVSSIDSGSSIATIQTTYSAPDGKALIFLAEGETYRLRKESKLRGEWTLVDRKQEEVCRLRERVSITKHEGDFSCSHLATGLPDRLLMALMVWYTVIVLLGKES